MQETTITNGAGSFDRALILMYHRVADVDTDPWSLCVTPQHFAEQLCVINELTKPTRLQDLPNALRNSSSTKPLVAITFDDGYADNLKHAVPLLRQHRVPATVFITTGYMGQAREFWWDELERLLLQPGRLPATLEVNVDGTAHNWQLGPDALYIKDSFQANRSWVAFVHEPPTSRHSVYLSLWKVLRPLEEKKRKVVLDQVRLWANAEPHARSTHRPLSEEEVCELAEDELIEIGCHTVTHPMLSALSESAQHEEIQHSKDYLDRITRSPVKSFAYPYGSRDAYSSDTVALVSNLGFDRACSTITNFVDLDTDRFQLPRLQVNDWDGDDFARWLTSQFS